MASFHRTKRTLENDMCPSYQAPTWVSTSLLTGFPGLEWAHRWNSLPICIGYLLALLGNATILHRVRTDPALHQPVYYFLAVLAGTSGPVVVHAALRAGCAVVVDPDGWPGALCSAAALPTLAVLFSTVLDSWWPSIFHCAGHLGSQGLVWHWSGSCWACGVLPSQPHLHCISWNLTTVTVGHLLCLLCLLPSPGHDPPNRLRYTFQQTLWTVHQHAGHGL